MPNHEKMEVTKDDNISPIWLKIMENDFYSIKEFAIKVKVHPNTIRRAIKNGRLSAFRIGSTNKGSYRICITEIYRMSIFDLEEIVNEMVENRIKEKESQKKT